MDQSLEDLELCPLVHPQMEDFIEEEKYEVDVEAKSIKGCDRHRVDKCHISHDPSFDQSAQALQ